MISAHIAAGISPLTGLDAHRPIVEAGLTLEDQLIVGPVGVCPSGLDGDNDQRVLCVPVQVSLPVRAAAACKLILELNRTVRTERSEVT